MTATAILHLPESPAAAGQFSVPMSADPASERLAAVRRAPRPGQATRGGTRPRRTARLWRGAGGALPPPLAARPPSRVPGHRRPGGRRGHRPGVVPGRNRALDRFDRRRPFGPWLHRITVNRAIDFSRARSLRAESVLSAAAEGVAPERDAISDELLAALASLGPEHRAVVVLRYVLEYTPGEIAEILVARDRELAAAARPRPPAPRSGGGWLVTADRACRRLRDVRVPGEHEAEERSWEIVRAAYAQRSPLAPARRTRRLVLALAGGAARSRSGSAPPGPRSGSWSGDGRRGRDRRQDAKPALRRCRRPASCWSSPGKGLGSCGRTAPSACSATTTRRPGRRAACSWRSPTGAS